MPRIPEAELRTACCRAVNRYLTHAMSEYRDRLTPVAMIPTTTPQEAIDELEYVVNVLGLHSDHDRQLRRPRHTSVGPPLRRNWAPGPAVGIPMGLTPEYDYDPFWARCVELGVAVTAHGGSRGTTLFQSVSNFTYNHIEHFAAAGHALARSLVLGGVTRRFPDLNFACLEGGAAWGVVLLHSLIEHWEVRGLPGLARVDPHNIDAGAVLAQLDQVRDPVWKDPALLSLLTEGEGDRTCARPNGRLRGMRGALVR